MYWDRRPRQYYLLARKVTALITASGINVHLHTYLGYLLSKPLLQILVVRVHEISDISHISKAWVAHLE